MPPEQTPLVPAPTVSPQASKIKLWWIILGIFVIAVSYFVLAANTYLWPFTEPDWITPENSLVASSTSPIATWQTYRNEEYGFEFRYPKNLTSVEKPTGEISFINKGGTNKGEFTLRINSLGFGIGEGCDEDYQKTTRIIDGISMEREQICGMTLYSFSLNENIYIDMYNYEISDQKEFDLILSTFKFTK